MGNFLSGTSGEQHLVEGTAPWYRYHAKNRTELGHAAFARSQAAYKNGDHSAAKKLSVEGKEHQRKAKELNDQAAALIFKDQNSDRNSGEVDLHGLKASLA